MSATTKSKRLVFFGNERLVSGLPHTDTPVLLGLIERGYEITCIVVNNSDSISRNARTLEVADIAKQHNIPILSPDRPGDVVDQLRDYNADFAILAAYGRIIPQRVIDVFSPIGIINIHPSLLPRHRGPTPIETTITSGDTIAGVSIMQLTAGMDEGPVYGQVAHDMQNDEDKFMLYRSLSKMGAELLFELLPAIVEGNLKPLPQQNDGVTYTTLINKKDGIIDPLTETADAISRKVRAHLGFPKSRLKYKDNDVIITSAKPTDSFLENHLCITCAQNTILIINSLIAPNGKAMSGEAYLRGLR